MKSKTLHSRLKLIGIIIGALIVLVALHVWVVTHLHIKASAKASPTPAALHTTTEAVKAAADLYAHYLPLKTQVVAAVGDNAFVEPALVQAVRGSEVYFDTKLYNDILADYTKEYGATGKVKKDDIGCVAGTTDTSSAALASSSGDSAIVNVTINLADGTSKLVPVTIDLHTLKATHIACS